MRPNGFLVLMPAALLALAGCTEQESPTGLPVPDAVSPQLLLAPASSGGAIVAWGENDAGQVSEGPPGNDFVAVSGGGNHGLALRKDGTLAAWGGDDVGEVGETPTDSGFVAIAAGSSYNVALREDGSLIAWGHDVDGQVSKTPTDKDFIAVAAGTFHSIALRGDGSLVSWGWDFYRQVTDTPPGHGFVAVAAGFAHSVALDEDGSLVSWGRDDDDQVSDTPSGSGFAAVVAGNFHNIALREDGSLIAWGRDHDAQVSETPSGNDFVAVAAGSSAGQAIQVSPADELSPAISIASPADSAAYLFGHEVIAEYACTDEDGGSGLASCTGSVANGEPINTAEVGTNMFVVDASDEAGNTATLTHTYTVAYDFSGFSAPVNNDGTFNAVNAGRTVPLEWRLVDASGQPITNLSSANVTVEDMACDLGSTADQIGESAPGASGLQNLGDGYYQFNWKTPKAYARSCKTLHLDLGEGLSRTALFRFTR